MNDSNPFMVKLVAKWMQDTMHLPPHIANLRAQCKLYGKLGETNIDSLEEREKSLDDKLILKYHQKHMRELTSAVAVTWNGLLRIENPTRSVCPLLREINGVERKLIRTVILYLCKKLPGKPRDCVKCGQRVTRVHMMSCSTAASDSLLSHIPSRLQNYVGMWPEIYISIIGNIFKYPEKEANIRRAALAIRKAAKDCIGFDLE